jgi:hypothetical protein
MMRSKNSSRTRFRLKVAATTIVLATVFQVVLLSASGAKLHAQSGVTSRSPERRTQGGTITFSSDGKLAQNSSSYVETVGLEGYVGQPLKALQLRVISRGGLKLRSVERGADIRNNSEWNLSHVIVHGKNGIDTAKVVIFGLGTTALPARQHSELLTVTYDVISSDGTGTAMLSLSDVLGALTRGENANVAAGPQRVVSLNKARRK